MDPLSTTGSFVKSLPTVGTTSVAAGFRHLGQVTINEQLW